MDLSFVIYLIGISSGVASVFQVISGFAIAASVLIGLVGIFCLGCTSESPGEFVNERLFLVKLLKWLRLTIPVAVIFGLASAAIPKEEYLAMMYVVPAIVENEDVQEEAKDLYILAKNGLKEMIGVEAPIEDSK